MLNIAVFVSGGGTNLQALIDAQANGQINNGKITLVVSSSSEAFALKRAEAADINTVTIKRKDYSSLDLFDNALLETVKAHHIDLIVLAGFMSILGENIIANYKDKIINVHPSLIPSFCGKGFYGLKVHEAALLKGVKITGATVHFVNEIPDDGKIILQKAVEIKEGDTPEILQKRVMEQAEWVILPQAVSLFCEGKI